MRNLKRVLALALALIMTLGLMITASAASYADADQIDANYGEAIEVLTNMGVFRGQANGGESTEFAPKDILTRAEAATLVYRLLTADVTDAKKSNYDYTSFDDVKEGEWWTGYITYAANGKYVVGYGNGKFGPNDQVTGIEVLTIMLRALGYGQNGEFVGGGWKDHVLTTANENGMLKNVFTDDLDKGASRELVAQLLFNAITVPKMVNYAPLNGYTKTTQTLGEKNFKLVEIDGVVTGNEYADLNDDEPLAEGKTVIDGKTYDLTTTLDDIGESRRGWAIDSKVLFLADTGLNTAEEFTAKAELKKAVKMKTNADTKSYVNFADPSVESYEAVYRIAYEMTGVTLTDRQVTALKEDGIKCVSEGGRKYTVSKTINAGKTVTDNDLDIIKTIFAVADEDDGYVYVGTQSTKDISNGISYRNFLKEYVETVVKSNDVTANENGNYVKVIDNDNDGVAEYILKTAYTMAAITDIAKSGDYTISGETESVKSDAVVTEDELAEGDVIVYALIDGVYYANKAEAVTDTIDTKGIDFKAETITCGETTYGQSGIGVNQISFNNAFLNDVFEFEVTQADTEMQYDFYLDNYGYVRAFALNDATNGLGLLTNAYYGTDRKTDVYKVDMVTASAEKTEYTVYDKRSDLSYIDTTEGDSGDRSTWGRLVGFQSVLTAAEKEYGLHSFKTNVAGYSGSTDSLIILNPEDYVKPAYIVEELDMTTVSALNNEKYNTVLDEDDIFATTDTVYFYYNTKGNVTTWTGYKNAPASVTLYSSDIAYTVAHKSAASDRYYVADVIVIEQKGSDKSASFLYDAYQRNTGWVVTTISGTADGWNTAAITSGLKAVNTTNSYAYPAFYEISKSADEVTKNYEDYNIYAAESETNANVNVRDYVYLTTNPGVRSFLTTSVEVYKVAYKNGDYSISNCKTIRDGDHLIFVTDGKSVEYVINVSESYYTDKNGIDHPILEALYQDIIADQGVRTGDVDVIFYGEEATFAPATGNVEGTYTLTISYADAKAYVEDYPAAKALRVNDGRITTGDTDADVALTTSGDTYRGTILSATGKYYNFVLVQEPAESQAMLFGQYVARTSLSDDYGHYYELLIPARFTIQDYLNSFDLSDDAIVDWYFETNGGTEIKFSGMEVPDLDKTIYNGVTTSEIKYVWAHVTSDDGKVENDFMNSKYFDEVFSRFDAKADITATHAGVGHKLTKDSSTQNAALTIEAYTLSVPKNCDLDAIERSGSTLVTVAWTHAVNTSVTRVGNVITVKADSDWRGRGYEATITIEERTDPTFGVTAWSASTNGNLCVAMWCNDWYYAEDFSAVYAPGELLREEDLEDLLDGIDQDNFVLYWNNDTHTASDAPEYKTADNTTYGDFTNPVNGYVTKHDYGFVKLNYTVGGNPVIAAGSTFNGQNGDTINANTGVFRLTLKGLNVAQVYAAIEIPAAANP